MNKIRPLISAENICYDISGLDFYCKFMYNIKTMCL